MKRILSDFHIHTEYSFDSEEKLDKVCESAISSGLSSIAITNHYDHDGIDEGIYEEYLFEKDMEDILRAKEKYKGRLVIFSGIEIGQPHILGDKKLSKIEALGYEFKIGSLHNLKNCFDFYYLNYKKTTDMYDRGIYNRYISELIEMTDCGFIDTLGHITYPERYMKEAGKDFVYSEFEEGFSSLFEKLAKSKVSLEINTSGLRQGLSHTMPKIELLELYKKCGGEYITVGSDAHKAEHVGADVEKVFEKANTMGFFHINEIKK